MKTSKRVFLSWLICLIALSLAGWIGQHSGQIWGALFMSGLVVYSVFYFRKVIDNESPGSIGLENIQKSIIKFLLGTGFVLIPMILTLSFTVIFGWGELNFNAGGSFITTILFGVVTVFLFEALPEELMFRGYIFSNLNVKYKTWISALMTIGLFVILPIFLVPIQKYLLGMEIYIGGRSAIHPSYLITMVFFGAFVQYLRILFKSIWVGVGFHLSFVYIDKIIGLEESSIIQITNATNQAGPQITLIILLLLIFISLILYPKLINKKIEWNELLN
jgi:membrane protease YdiL (CAAX protease family)